MECKLNIIFEFDGFKFIERWGFLMVFFDFGLLILLSIFLCVNFKILKFGICVFLNFLIDNDFNDWLDDELDIFLFFVFCLLEDLEWLFLLEVLVILYFDKKL